MVGLPNRMNESHVFFFFSPLQLDGINTKYGHTEAECELKTAAAFTLLNKFTVFVSNTYECTYVHNPHSLPHSIHAFISKPAWWV